MGLIVQIDGGGKEFEQIEDLIQNAVLADVEDLGLVDNKFKPGTQQHKCRFVYIVAEEDSEGRNKRAFERFTVSLNDRATLRKRLKSMGYTDEQLEAEGGFDLESIIGKKVKLVMSKEDAKDKSGRVFVNITAVMPLKKNESAPDIPSDFIRAKDKTAK